MARISSYPKDTTIQDNDAWIGSAFPNRNTKNFLASDVAKYLNTKGKISVSGQMVFQFKADVSEAGAGDFYGVTTETPFSSITSLNVSITDKSPQNVVEFLSYLVGSNILISEQNNIDQFGHFTVDSYTDNADGFYTLNLTYIGGNGQLIDTYYYDIASFIISSESGDKNYVHNQSVAAVTWTVNHNLDKYASATMVLSTGQKGYGDITYIDENTLTITFASAESGKAYIN